MTIDLDGIEARVTEYAPVGSSTWTDAAFISHALRDVPALVSEVRRLERELAACALASQGNAAAHMDAERRARYEQ